MFIYLIIKLMIKVKLSKKETSYFINPLLLSRTYLINHDNQELKLLWNFQITNMGLPKVLKDMQLDSN